MATQKTKDAPASEEPQDKRKTLPQLVARAKINDQWETVGAAWRSRDGADPNRLFVKLKSPLPGDGWDGTFMLVPRLER
jgi:hypothetical protein